MKTIIAIITIVMSFASIAKPVEDQLARVKTIAKEISIELDRPVVWVDGSLLGLGKKTIMGQTTGKSGDIDIYIIGVNQQNIMFMGDKKLKAIMVHELAHAKADDVYGLNGVNSHGSEWKKLCRAIADDNGTAKKLCKAKY